MLLLGCHTVYAKQTSERLGSDSNFQPIVLTPKTGDNYSLSIDDKTLSVTLPSPLPSDVLQYLVENNEIQKDDLSLATRIINGIEFSSLNTTSSQTVFSVLSGLKDEQGNALLTADQINNLMDNYEVAQFLRDSLSDTDSLLIEEYQAAIEYLETIQTDQDKQTADTLYDANQQINDTQDQANLDATVMDTLNENNKNTPADAAQFDASVLSELDQQQYATDPTGDDATQFDADVLEEVDQQWILSQQDDAYDQSAQFDADVISDMNETQTQNDPTFDTAQFDANMLDDIDTELDKTQDYNAEPTYDQVQFDADVLEDLNQNVLSQNPNANIDQFDNNILDEMQLTTDQRTEILDKVKDKAAKDNNNSSTQQ